MKSSKSRFFLKLAVLASSFGITAEFAQTNSGSITGTVTDPSGAGVPGVTVTAIGTATGGNYTTITSADGNYSLPQVQVGAYDVTVTDPSFKTNKQSGVVVRINTPTGLNVQLQLGQTAETIEVVANAPTVQSTTSDVGAVVNTPIGTNSCTGASVYAGQIFNPTSTTASSSGVPCRTAAYPNNVIPTSQLSSIAQNVLSYLPAPNLPGLQNNFSFRASLPTNNTTYTIRIDQNLGTYDKIFASYDTRQNTLLTIQLEAKLVF